MFGTYGKFKLIFEMFIFLVFACRFSVCNEIAIFNSFFISSTTITTFVLLQIWPIEINLKFLEPVGRQLNMIGKVTLKVETCKLFNILFTLTSYFPPLSTVFGFCDYPHECIIFSRPLQLDWVVKDQKQVLTIFIIEWILKVTNSMFLFHTFKLDWFQIIIIKMEIQSSNNSPKQL